MKKKLFTLILLSGLLVTGCNNKESSTTEVATTTDATTTDATEEVIEEPEFDSVSVYQTSVTRDDGKGEAYDVSITMTGSNCTVYVDGNTYNFVLADNTYTSEEDCVFGGVNYGKTFTLINKSDNRYLLSYLDTEDFEYLVVGEVAIEEETVTTEEIAEATVNSGAGNKPKPSNNKPSTNTKPSANTKPSTDTKPSNNTKPSSDTKPSTSNSSKPGTSTASGNTGNTSQTTPQTTPQTTTPSGNNNVTTEEYVSAVTPGTKPETTEPEECIHDYKKVIAQEAWDETITVEDKEGIWVCYCCGTKIWKSDGQLPVACQNFQCGGAGPKEWGSDRQVRGTHTETVHHDATYYYQCSKCGQIKY